MISGSADKTLRLFDLNNSFKEIACTQALEEIFCGDLYENFCIVGCRDGNIYAYNLDNMTCIYGYGVDNVGGVTQIKILPEIGRIATGGESGQGMLIKV